MKKTKDKTLIAILLFIGFQICIFAPYELYILNSKEFWFRFITFWFIPPVVFFIMALAGYIIGTLIPPKGRSIYKAFLFSVAVCMYLQGNFLNIDVGPMNGSDIEWAQYQPAMIRNAVIWLIIIVATITFTCFKTELADIIMRYGSYFVSSFLFLTLIILMIQNRDVCFASSRQKTFLSDKAEYDMNHSEGDVVVFLLDMFDDRYFKEIMANGFEELDEFDGFTYFANHTGAYSSTNYSLRLLLSGRMFYNEFDQYDWSSAFNDDRLYLDVLSENGYDMYFYPDSLDGILPERTYLSSVNLETGHQIISNKLHFSYDLYQLVMCRFFPDLIKPYIWMTGNEFKIWKSYDSEGQPAVDDNIKFYDRFLKHDGIADTSNNPEFKFIYLIGAHYPFDMDANINRVENNSVTPIDTAEGCLRIIAQYIRRLKAEGTYDNTAIIVTADHGLMYGGEKDAPFMIIKPAGAHGELKVNSAPVSQNDFAATVLYLAGIDEYRDFGESVFEVAEDAKRDRYFYQYYLGDTDPETENWRMIEYKIDPYGNSYDHYHLTDVEYTAHGTKIKHSDYCELCHGIDDLSVFDDEEILIHGQLPNYPKE